MYIEYFGLRDYPFSITPDPAFLYMSPRHQEALGHLLYGTGQYGGFVQLTGEVGTGKTTVIRTLLSQKIDGVDVAMVYNPRQSEHEFLASVCDELKIDYPEGASQKTLVDALNRHLLAAHAGGRRTVLIIDEAQNLSPGVLEQVRLLTNLETHKDKLLRIMLVGQPELAELLARPELRQLAQRITARYHLQPLSEDETREYIRHRLRVAGASAELFSDDAIRLVQSVSRGIPRLTNIICDRALLGAFGRQQRTVNAELVRAAAAESMADTVALPRGRWDWLLELPDARIRQIEIALAALAVVLIALLIWRTWQPDPTTPAPQAPAAAPIEPAQAPATEAAAPAASQQVPAVAQDPLSRAQRPLGAMMTALARQWLSDFTPDSTVGACTQLQTLSLRCYRGDGEWDLLRRLALPVLLELDNAGQPTHVLVLGLGSDHARLHTPEGSVDVPRERLEARWDGPFLMIWQPPTESERIDRGSRGEPVLWLRQRLAQLNGQTLPDPPSAAYDGDLRDQVRAFQRGQDLIADGVVGVHTFILLGQGLPGWPRLQDLDDVPAA